MSDAKLKSLVERIENLEEERKAIGGDVRDIYVEAKSAGYQPKALRKVVAQRRQKTDEALEAEVERYRAALGMGSYREVSAQLGVSKSKLQRLVPRKANGTPHDPETGEINGQEERGEAGEGAGPHSGDAGGQPKLDGHLPGRLEGDRQSPDRAVETPATAAITDTRTFDEIAGEIPAFLRCVPAMSESSLCGCKKCTSGRVVPEADVWPGPLMPGWRYACERCGNKRCPHHSDHTLDCTESNEPGQVGSIYA